MLIAALLSYSLFAQGIDAYYIVNVPGNGSKTVSVEMTLLCDTPREIPLTIGAGNSYPFRRFGEFVEDLDVEVNGEPEVKPRKESADTWVLPRGQQFVVRYRVRIAHLEADSRRSVSNVPYFGPSFLTFPTIGLFLRPGRGGSPQTDLRFVQISFRLPSGWEVATNYEEVASKTFRAPKPEAFGQYAYFAAGRFDRSTMTIGGTKVVLVTCGSTYGFKRERFREVAADAVRAVYDFYGGLPEDRLLIIAAPLPGSKGRRGVSFGGSVSRSVGMSMMLSIDEKMGEKELRSDVATLILHETFHLGNPRSNTPDTWFREGFTTYYGYLLAVRNGFISEEHFYRRLAELGLNDRRRPAVSLVEAGKRMFTDPACYRHVYAGGALVAFQLDVEMRRRGVASLDELMRRLYTDYTLKGRPYTLAQLRTLIRDLSTYDFQPLVDRYVEGDAWPNIELLLYDLGQSVEVAKRDVTMGVTLDARAPGGLKVVSVDPGSPGAAAGLKPGDLITAVEGTTTRTDSAYRQALARAPESASVSISIRRREEPLTLEAWPRWIKQIRIEPAPADPSDRDLLKGIVTATK